MLLEEAKWFGERLRALDPSSVFPMLNVGSSTEKVRREVQPWVDEYIFKPARERGLRVVHMDIVAGPGVDLVGDLADPACFAQVCAMGFRSVFCTNLLEHVRDKEALAAAILSLVPEGGHIFVSCPYKYPYHPEPLDTLFRPGVDELAGLFPGTQVSCSDIVTGGTAVGYVNRRPFEFLKKLLRMLVPFYRSREWFSWLRTMPWLLARFQETCLVLRKEAPARGLVA
jgi:SAM-dependent methyltransferase